VFGGAWIGATFEERSHRGSTAIAHRAVQRGDPVFIECIWVGASPNQSSNDLHLGTRIPCWQARATINGIMEWLCTTPVSCANVRSLGDQLRYNAGLIRRCCHMKGGIALVNVVQNLIEEMLLGSLPSCTTNGAFFCQHRRSINQLDGS
jgi:hypothetical protein